MISSLRSKGDASVAPKDSKPNVSSGGGGSSGKAIHPSATTHFSSHAAPAAVKAAHAGARVAAGKAAPVGGALPVEGDTGGAIAALDYGGYPPPPMPAAGMISPLRRAPLPAAAKLIL